MTSKLTRERIQRIMRAINSEAYDEEEIREWLSSDEIMELSRMALAAMDSESGCLPLDYLQGHKDGLEWAARLAEANHPETGDWLYDDPIELAKAIRKGPDMPPVQPVADSEPDRNPVLAYADSYRDMAKQGVESVPIWSVITDLERNIAPLYRHAQPAPVVQKVMSRLAYLLDEDQFHNIESMVLAAGIHPAGTSQVIPEVMSTEDLQYKPLTKSWREGWNSCRAAMLQTKSLTSINPAPDLVSLQKKAESIIGNYPGIPDCWCRTCRPVVLNDMRFVVCPDCGNKRCPRANDHKNACTGSNEPGQEGSAYPVTPRG
ncbi:hypothetical protein [Klebsiella variicola]|uniref:hypothetical protein n=1 Tax=Klebsiella variicola TaxID=244366 RepID=UPI003879FD5D